MAITRQLYQLQELDTEIDLHERSLREKEAQVGADKQVVLAQKKLTEGESRLQELQRRQHDLEWEIGELDGKIKAAEDKLYGGKINNPKELTSLQQDIKMLKEQRDGVETDDLGVIDGVESTETAVVQARAALAKTKEEYTVWQDQLDWEIKQLKMELENLNAERQVVAATVDSVTLASYDKLRKAKGQAVAKVEQGMCKACRISLSTAELQQVKGGAVRNCGSCGRILYLP